MSFVQRLDKETKALERRQEELSKFIKNNLHTQSALAAELDEMERKLDELLLAKESTAHATQGQGPAAAGKGGENEATTRSAPPVALETACNLPHDAIDNLLRSLVFGRRGEMYREAQELDVQVDKLSREMVDLVERLNRSTEEKSTADDTVAKVERILNEQYKTMHWVEAEGEKLRAMLTELRAHTQH